MYVNNATGFVLKFYENLRFKPLFENQLKKLHVVMLNMLVVAQAIPCIQVKIYYYKLMHNLFKHICIHN